MKRSVALLCLLSATALADGKRRVAVFEYRAGARGAVDIGVRLADELSRSSSYEVIGPVEARRRFGGGLDADVARCAGEAHCTAALARRVGADEGLLVGVSQLGDVVLALQRLDAQRGVAVTRLAESMPVDKQPTEAEMVDWLHQLFPADAFLRYGAIKIMVDVDDVKVSVNGVAHGTTPLEDALRVPAPGSYRVRLEKTGFAPFQARIDVPPDATVEVRATMSRETAATPWFKRWYVWAAVGAVAAGAGAGIAIYYGTRVDQTPHGYIVPPP